MDKEEEVKFLSLTSKLAGNLNRLVEEFTEETGFCPHIEVTKMEGTYGVISVSFHIRGFGKALQEED